MNTPVVSVCVVTYNQENYIRDCILSAVAQHGDVPLEILVGDDHSDDDTPEIIRALAEQYPDIIRPFRREVRLGCAARNYQALIKEAQGEFIAHLDGDDFWLPGKLRSQLECLRTRPDVAAVYSDAVVVDEAGALRGGFSSGVSAFFDLGYLIEKGNFLCHATLVYRAAEKDAVLDLPDGFLDFHVHVALAQRGTLAFLARATAGYRVASVTSMSVRQPEKVREGYWAALKSVNANAVAPRQLASATATFLLYTMLDSVLSGNWAGARLWARRVFAEGRVGTGRLVLQGLAAFWRLILFKAGNALAIRVLRRPLKTYFRR